MTIRSSYRHFLENLIQCYSDREAKQMADWVFEKVTGTSPIERIMRPEKELLPGQGVHLDQMLHDLLDHIPVQYVLKEAWFYKRPFYVNKEVLIPRPETEELVEWVLKDMEDRLSREVPLQFLDIGTGSGCIAISIKKGNPRTEAWAIDKYPAALEVARKNAAALRAEVHFMQTDLFREGWETQIPEMDVIVSNPPYIPVGEKAGMQSHVVGQEPDSALFVPSADPLIFYKAVLDIAQKKLKPGGKIYVEVHEDFGAAVKTLFEKALIKVTLKKDLNGKDRMVRGQFQG